MTMTKTHYTITLQTKFFKENGVVVGVAPELNVSSFGKTLKEAKSSLSEAIEGFLETCEEMGTLEEVLEEAGFVVKQNRYLWQPPIKTNLNTAGISRSRYFELVKQV